MGILLSRPHGTFFLVFLDMIHGGWQVRIVCSECNFWVISGRVEREDGSLVAQFSVHNIAPSTYGIVIVRSA